jgi:hypothetical protein
MENSGIFLYYYPNLLKNEITGNKQTKKAINIMSCPMLWPTSYVIFNKRETRLNIQDTY